MDKCYNYFDCQKKHDCPAYNTKKDTKCWKIKGTLCDHELSGILNKHHRTKCDFCLYYQYRKS